MRSKDILNEYYDAENDNYNNREVDDVRKQRLTLKHPTVQESREKCII